MKKYLSLFLALALMLSLTACSSKTDTEEVIEEEVIEEILEEEIEEEEAEPEEEEAEEEAEAEALSYTITTQDATVMYVIRVSDVRSQPGVSGIVLGTLTKGEEVTVTGVCDENGWYQIAYGDDEAEGYVSSSALSEEAPATTTAQQTSSGTSTSSSSSSSSSKSSDSSSSSSSGSSWTLSGDGNGNLTITSESDSSSSSSSSGKTVDHTYTSSDGVTYTYYTDGSRTSDYSCGVSWHKCQNAGDHEEATSLLANGCPYCGCNDLSCGYFYFGKLGGLCVNNTGCSSYDSSKDTTYLCERCGKEMGDGTNGTCASWLWDVTCPNCGESVSAYTCHYCS